MKCQHLLLWTLAASLMLGGCAPKMVRSVLSFTSDGSLPTLDEPLVDVSRYYRENQARYETVTVFVVEAPKTADSALLRAVEGAFISGGFEVLEIRQVSNLEVSRFLSKQEEQPIDTEAVAVIYQLESTKYPNSITLDAVPNYEYGTNLKRMTTMSPAQVDKKVGRVGSMENVLKDTEDEIQEEIEKQKAVEPDSVWVAKMEARLVDTETRRVLMHYLAATFSDPREDENSVSHWDGEVRTYAYNKRKRKFVRAEDESPVYASDLILPPDPTDPPDVQLVPPDLKAARKACDAFVHTLRHAGREQNAPT